MSDVRTLYRPVGLFEMDLIFQSACKAFPPRLPEQPVFYPVLNEKYAESIVLNWNLNDPFAGYAGFVTAFDMPGDYLKRFDEKIVGSDTARELWVPAEELAAFNAQISGRIRMIKSCYGAAFKGLDPATDLLGGKDLENQFYALEELLRKGAAAFAEGIVKERRLAYLHYPYWSQPTFLAPHLPQATKQKILEAIATAWKAHFPDIALLNS